MSASAGRVLILLKGEYNSATSYQMLDAVRYNGSLYIAKKATLGNVPQDGENWMLCASGATWGDIGGIITNQTDLMNLLNGKQNTLTFDTVPTASSTNPVTSAGIKTAVDAKITNPAGGSVGDVLRKTATGEAWTAETESAWGSITGNIDSQTDLKTKLDASASNIATIESTAFASKAYVEGEFLTYNGQLYEVIAAIALGEALVIGTNIEAKSVSDKFVSINSEIETLNNGLTNLTTIETYSFTAMGTKNIYMYKMGRLVFIDSPYDATSASSGVNTLGTLPEKYRPIRLIRAPIANRTNSTWFAQIETSGVLSVYVNQEITSATNMSFSFVYFSAS